MKPEWDNERIQSMIMLGINLTGIPVKARLTKVHSRYAKYIIDEVGGSTAPSRSSLIDKDMYEITVWVACKCIWLKLIRFTYCAGYDMSYYVGYVSECDFHKNTATPRILVKFI